MTGTGFLTGFVAGLTPPPEMTISEWSDENVILPDTSAEPGRWRTDRAPYQREPMDECTNPRAWAIVLHCSAQTGKSQILLNVAGYHIHHSPCPMMLIEPSLPMAEGFAKDKLDPLIAATPVIRDKITSNTILHKQFAGGSLTLIGANSAASLAMRSIKVVLADETDRYPPSVGEEGDPLLLAWKRTQSFRMHGAKLIAASTPKTKGTSRIDGLFELSDKRYYHVPCPHCDHEQKLVWEGVKWTAGKPETAEYLCESCGSLISDSQIKMAVKKGRWIAEAPFTGIAGFHIWQIYSPFSTLAEIVRDYEASEGKPAERQTWWNTVLGESWDASEAPGSDAATLFSRREKYPPNVCPRDAAAICASVDVQHDRLEVLIGAFGVGNECWLLDLVKLYGDTSTDAPWSRLEETLLRRFPHALNPGRTLPIEAAAIDSGFRTQKVYDFARKNMTIGRLWYAVKGLSGEGKVPWTQSKEKLKSGTRLYLVGIDDMKTEIYRRLGFQPGVGFHHFREADCFDLDFFKQVVEAERVRVVHDTKGFPKREWWNPMRARNEGLDLLVYLEAVHRSLNIDHKARLATFRAPVQRPDFGALAEAFAG